MTSAFRQASLHALYRILNTKVSDWPHRHLLIENVFPAEFYARLLNALPGSDAYTPLAQTGKVAEGDYAMRAGFLLDDKHRARVSPAISEFWQSLFDETFSPEFAAAIAERHEAQITSRFLREGRERPAVFGRDMLLVRDGTSDGVKIHTSDRKNVVTLLFYLPPDERYVACGTTLYLPKDREFRCWGGHHYDFELFDKVATMPFRPNSLFMFVKDDDSFHGVEPLRIEAIRRDLLLFYIQI